MHIHPVLQPPSSAINAALPVEGETVGKEAEPLHFRKAEPRWKTGDGETNTGANQGLALREVRAVRAVEADFLPPQQDKPSGLPGGPKPERQSSSSRSPSANPVGHWKRS
jgi:hypothetical protein